MKPKMISSPASDMMMLALRNCLNCASDVEQSRKVMRVIVPSSVTAYLYSSTQPLSPPASRAFLAYPAAAESSTA